MSYIVNNIYPAFMGECNKYGIGSPCTFIRLAGCNLRCYHKTKGCFCDTPEALNADAGNAMQIDEILQAVNSYENKLICLTGGEPLMLDVAPLLQELSFEGYNVVVETNGSRSIMPYRHIRNVSFVVDIKVPSTGENDKMHFSNCLYMDENDFVKFVLDTEEDYQYFVEWLNSTGYKCSVAVGLFWGSQISYSDLSKRLLRLKDKVYLNMQTHKMMYMYDNYKDNSDFSQIGIPSNI